MLFQPLLKCLCFVSSPLVPLAPSIKEQAVAAEDCCWDVFLPHSARSTAWGWNWTLLTKTELPEKLNSTPFPPTLSQHDLDFQVQEAATAFVFPIKCPGKVQAIPACCFQLLHFCLANSFSCPCLVTLRRLIRGACSVNTSATTGKC